MKKILISMLFLLNSCAHTLLSTNDDNLTIINTKVGDFRCVHVNEWDTSEYRKDKQKVSCWCLSPVQEEYGTMIFNFILADDKQCKEE